MDNNKLDDPAPPGARGGGREILCVGITPCLQRSLVFKRLQVGEVNRTEAVRLGASGKATNAARVLRALGEPSRLLSLIGGPTGRLFESFVMEEGFVHDVVVREAPTRICETLLDDAAGTVTELVEEMSPPAPADWAGLRAALKLRRGVSDLALVPGTMPPGVPAETYADFIRAAVHLGYRVLLDTSGPPLLSALAAHPLLVKLNQSELERTLGRAVQSEPEAVQALRELSERGGGWVGVTRGPRPAWWWDGHSAYSLSLPAVPVVSPIGSGDAVLAGMAARLNRGASSLEAFRFGLACGCANAGTAWPGEVEAAAVTRWLESIHVEPMGGGSPRAGRG